jgi:hypothetical protein
VCGHCLFLFVCLYYSIYLRGDTIKSFIDGSDIRHFSSKQRNALLLQSFIGIVTLILLVVGIVVSIYIIRYAISPDVGDSNAQTIASICNAVQISVVNYIYSFIANALSERENHRTNTEVSTLVFLVLCLRLIASRLFLLFVSCLSFDPIS